MNQLLKKISILLALTPIISCACEPSKEAAEQTQNSNKHTAAWVKEHIRNEQLTNEHLILPAPTTYTFSGGRLGKPRLISEKEEIPISEDGEILWPTKQMYAEIEAQQIVEDHLSALHAPEKVHFNTRIEKPEADEHDLYAQLHEVLNTVRHKEIVELLQSAQNALIDTNNEDAIL